MYLIYSFRKKGTLDSYISSLQNINIFPAISSSCRLANKNVEYVDKAWCESPRGCVVSPLVIWSWIWLPTSHDNPNPYLPSLGIVQRRQDSNSATNNTIIKPGAVMATHFLEFLRYAGSQICIVTAHREPYSYIVTARREPYIYCQFRMYVGGIVVKKITRAIKERRHLNNIYRFTENTAKKGGGGQSHFS